MDGPEEGAPKGKQQSPFSSRPAPACHRNNQGGGDACDITTHMLQRVGKARARSISVAARCQGLRVSNTQLFLDTAHPPPAWAFPTRCSMKG